MAFNNQVILGNQGTGSATISGGTFTQQTAGIFYLGVNAGGTLTISNTGSVSLLNLNVGYQSSSHATVNLNGGTLKLFNETVGGGSGGTGAGSTFNFNSGTLQAGATFTAPTAVSTVVQSGGAIIDTNTFNITIPTALTNGGGGGGLTKLGTGTLTLTGANTYTGLTDVQAGELDLNTTSSNSINGNLQTSGGTAKLLQSNQIVDSATVTVNSGTLSNT